MSLFFGGIIILFRVVGLRLSGREVARGKHGEARLKTGRSAEGKAGARRKTVERLKGGGLPGFLPEPWRTVWPLCEVPDRGAAT